MLTTRTKSLLYTAICLACSSSLADSSPGFYQHLQGSDPHRRVEELLANGWSVRNHAPLPIALPLDWAADPHSDPKWRYQLNAMYPIAPAFQALEDEYRSELHELVRSVFDDWIDFNLNRDIDHAYRWRCAV